MIRRPFISFLAALAFLSPLVGNGAEAQPRHGLSAFGDLKYPATFTHFDYVNPNAPKGGRLALIGVEARITFNSFNYYILKGDAAQGLPFLFDTLMARAWDEPDAVYGLVAKTAEVAKDGLSVTFVLRREARFADGSPLTADDVANSLLLLKEKGDPRIALQLTKVAGAEALAPDKVRFVFTEANRDLPLVVATFIPIFSKAYYSSHDFAESTLKPPLGSGPYEISDFKQGRHVTFARRKDYWARDLPVNRGQYNFDELRYEYFRDRTAQFEGLKAGAFDLREEFTSKVWATQYDIPPVREGRLIKETLPDERPSGAQGFFMNIRREKFADPRTREALGLAFDFEWTNRNLFYELYTRTQSFFENSEMKAVVKPAAEELLLLEPHRAALDESVFGDPYVPPVSDGSGQDRKLLRRASKLLNEAGWRVKDGKRVNAEGKTLAIEFLVYAPTLERIIGPYIKNLQVLGIDAKIRLVDPAQYESRRKTFDFDVIVSRFVVRQTPGVEVENYFGSVSAGIDGSLNLSGVANPVIDALIGHVVRAESRDRLNAAARALDRVLRAEHFWVPHWYKAAHSIAFWNKFSRPDVKPRFNRGIIATWWYDEDKAAKLEAAGN